ncbi:MAG: esterase/lipase family protein [Phycisphaerae bacterium]
MRFKFLMLSPLLICMGCQLPAQLHAPSRLQYGQVYVLPGIEGGNVLARNIALGLDEGGVQSAIEIYDWTTGIPGNFVVNLAYFERNRRVAREFAAEIAEYQRRHPQRPIHLVGHSGGAGILVMALENLPEDAKVDSAILLGAALSQDYDLSTALRHVHNGIVNFYSRRDVGFLKVGTSILGPIDREFGVAAGAEGFTPPIDLTPESRRLYAQQLRQIGWNPRLKRYGADGTHLGWAKLEFARRFIAPIITRNEARYGTPRGDYSRPAPDVPGRRADSDVEDAVRLPGRPLQDEVDVPPGEEAPEPTETATQPGVRG